jgi:hypothetical protein
MSLAKAWTVSEAQTLKFSADFFDLWNHPVFDKASITDIENPSFGRSRTPWGRRGWCSFLRVTHFEE